MQPAASGGETPLVDSREVYRRLDPALRRPFEDKGVMYVRNYGDGLGLDWRTVFQADTREQAEARLREQHMAAEWKDGDRLRTRCVRPAVIAHPHSGERSWFNQAQHFHVACLDADTRRSLEAIFAPEDLPRNCYYGDGTPIEDSVMAEILGLYRELEVVFPWRRGDIAMVDNVLAAHGRNPFTPPRKILVAMAEMTNYRDLGA
jgi:alpha-ketoglutarate-dependent taurine dioxygenase